MYYIIHVLICKPMVDMTDMMNNTSINRSTSKQLNAMRALLSPRSVLLPTLAPTANPLGPGSRSKDKRPKKQCSADAMFPLCSFPF